ncbi:MAG: FtsX-like permease family protein [Candidatus Thorarchaeota archaeon]
MSEFQGFASKDLKRRPFRNAIVLVSLSSAVASATFIFLFGNALLDVTSYSLASALSTSMGTFFSTFVWAVLLLVFALGAVVISTTISLEMVTRRRDIGLMKAMGTLMDSIFDFFMAQSVIVLLASICLGLSIGTVLYLLGMIWLAGVVPGLQFSFEFPWLQLGFLAIIYLIAGYFSAQKPIYDTVQESPSVTLNPDVGMRVRKSGFLDDLGLAFRVASKGTGRRLKGTRRTALALFLSFTIASLLWIGGGVVETTSQSYMIRSMGTNIVGIGNPTMLDQYYSAYSFYGSPLNDTFTFLESSDMINNSLVTEIQNTLGVLALESRLVVFDDILARQATVWNQELEQYEIVGEERDGTALLIGIDWSSTLSDWYYEGLRINSTQQAWIGGSLANELFVDPLIQPLEIAGQSLVVRALAFDTLNGGKMAIMDRTKLQEYYGVTGSNLLLVQIDSYDEAVINQLEVIAQSYGMSIYRQQDVLDDNLQAIHSIWVLLNPLALMALISAFLALMNYLLVSIFGRLRDYIIMQSIGAKPSFIAKLMIAEGLDVGLRAGLPALLVGTVLSVFALIPEAAVPTIAYLPFSIITLFVAIISVIFLSAIPVYVFFMTRNTLTVSEFSS